MTRITLHLILLETKTESLGHFLRYQQLHRILS
jgi:hypothetical protein